MPLYSFKCYTCLKETTANFSITDKHEMTCDCGQEMKKIFTSPPIIFKGNGWAAKE